MNKYSPALSVVLIISGAILLVCSFLGVIDGSWAGFGIIFLLNGFREIKNIHRYKTDPEYREALEMEQSDERSQFIAGKACVMTVSSYIIIAFVALILCKIAGREDWMMFFAVNIGLIFLLYIVSYVAIKDKY